MRSLTKKTAFGAVGVLAAVGITGTAWAETGSGSSSTTSTASALSGSGGSTVAGSTASASAAGGATTKHKARGLLGRADHATAEIKVKGQWVTYTLDRGTVTQVSPTSITLHRPDGQSVTDSIDSATKFEGVSSESAIQTGKRAQVISDGGVALRIRQAAS